MTKLAKPMLSLPATLPVRSSKQAPSEGQADKAKGFWQDSSNGHVTSDIVPRSSYPWRYLDFSTTR
jgi:hypothetical protein